MLRQKLADLKSFILKYNTYFIEGYDNVVQDDTNGIVNDGKEPIFPADDKGNFFYLRLPNQLVPDYNSQFSIADNSQSIGVRFDIIMVACLSDGDASLLLENLITTLGKYNDEQLRITKMIYQGDTIIIQELAKVQKKENIDSALQKLPENMALACVHFSFTIPFIFQNLNCLKDPCKTC